MAKEPAVATQEAKRPWTVHYTATLVIRIRFDVEESQLGFIIHRTTLCSRR